MISDFGMRIVDFHSKRFMAIELIHHVAFSFVLVIVIDSYVGSPFSASKSIPARLSAGGGPEADCAEHEHDELNDELTE